MNDIELEYKRSTGEYPKKRLCGNTTRSGGIYLPSYEISEWYSEMEEWGFMEISSREYVAWLENKIQELKNNKS